MVEREAFSPGAQFVMALVASVGIAALSQWALIRSVMFAQWVLLKVFKYE